jgi:hypothetical protein
LSTKNVSAESHTKTRGFGVMVGGAGLEPATSSMSIR